jgi:hypothetical protein
LPEARARWTDTLGQVSDLQGQFGERVGKSSGRRSVGAEIVEPATEVLNEGMACDDDPGGSVTFQSSHRSKSGLEASVVGINGIVLANLATSANLTTKSSRLSRRRSRAANASSSECPWYSASDRTISS